jgi:hypothetical protein
MEEKALHTYIERNTSPKADPMAEMAVAVDMLF